DSNPVRDVGFEPEFARERYLTEDEEKRLREVLSAEDWAVVEFALHTGLRQANQFHLRWDEIDLRAGLMIIPGCKAKNGEPIYQPMNDVVRAILCRLPSRLKSEWVFPTANSTTPLDPRNFCR